MGVCTEEYEIARAEQTVTLRMLRDVDDPEVIACIAQTLKTYLADRSAKHGLLNLIIDLRDCKASSTMSASMASESAPDERTQLQTTSGGVLYSRGRQSTGSRNPRFEIDGRVEYVPQSTSDSVDHWAVERVCDLGLDVG